MLSSHWATASLTVEYLAPVPNSKSWKKIFILRQHLSAVVNQATDNASFYIGARSPVCLFYWWKKSRTVSPYILQKLLFIICQGPDDRWTCLFEKQKQTLPIKRDLLFSPFIVGMGPSYWVSEHEIERGRALLELQYRPKIHAAFSFYLPLEYKYFKHLLSKNVLKAILFICFDPEPNMNRI